MGKIVSCGIAPIRIKDGTIEILLCKPSTGGYFGMGFLKGQIEQNETVLDAAKREFAEESGGLDVEIINEDIMFIQNNPKKKIYIWPAKVLNTLKNSGKITSEGIVPEHDHENDLIKFYKIDELPEVFKNQQKILSDLLNFVEEHKTELI